jgi:hypothetical protein
MSKRRHVLKLSWNACLGDAALFAFFFVALLLMVHFDVRRHGPSFQHPVAWAKSAWIALLLAIPTFIVAKIIEKIKGRK